MERFGSIDHLQGATVEEIGDVPGFGPKLAAELHAFLGNNGGEPEKTP